MHGFEKYHFDKSLGCSDSKKKKRLLKSKEWRGKSDSKLKYMKKTDANIEIRVSLMTCLKNEMQQKKKEEIWGFDE